MVSERSWLQLLLLALLCCSALPTAYTCRHDRGHNVPVAVLVRACVPYLGNPPSQIFKTTVYKSTSRSQTRERSFTPPGRSALLRVFYRTGWLWLVHGPVNDRN